VHRLVGCRQPERCRKPSNDTTDLRPGEIKVEDVLDTARPTSMLFAKE
jgi:hypothetical protein